MEIAITVIVYSALRRSGGHVGRRPVEAEAPRGNL